MRQLRDAAVIRHLSYGEDRVLCEAAQLQLAGRREDARRMLADFDLYYHTSFEGRQTRTTHLSRGTLEAAKLASRLTPPERAKLVLQSTTVDEDTKDWIIRCLP
jgi:hypothetical protein